jgi:hypothetical protein
MLKECRTCKKPLPLYMFYNQPRGMFGAEGTCKKCRAKRGAYRAATQPKLLPNEPRQCCTCKDVKPASEFYKNKTIIGGRSRRCKACSLAMHKEWRGRMYSHKAGRECMRNYFKQWRENNPEKEKAHSAKEHQRRVRARNYILSEAKKDGCVVCGYNKCRTALDLHHIDPSEKENLIGKIRGIQGMKDEIQKCVVLCKNCHAELHAGLLSDSNILVLKGARPNGPVAAA